MDGARAVQQEMVINAVTMIVDFTLPALMQVAHRFPALSFRYRPSLLVEQMQGAPGQVCLAIRAGGEPVVPGFTVRPLGVLGFGLYAAEDYVRRRGTAATGADLARHTLVNHDNARDYAPWEHWITAEAPDAPVMVRTNDEAVHRFAVRSGHCAAFLPISTLIWNPHLREVMAPRDEWSAALWLVSPPAEAIPPDAAAAADMLGDLLSRCLR